MKSDKISTFRQSKHVLLHLKFFAVFLLFCFISGSPTLSTASQGMPKAMQFKRANNGQKIIAELANIDLSMMKPISCTLKTYSYSGPPIVMNFGKERYALVTPQTDKGYPSTWSGHALFSRDCPFFSLENIYHLRLRFNDLSNRSRSIELDWNRNNGQLKLSESIADEMLSFANGKIIQIWN